MVDMGETIYNRQDYANEALIHSMAEQRIRELHDDMVAELEELISPDVRIWNRIKNHMITVHKFRTQMARVESFGDLCNALMTKGKINFGEYDVLKCLSNTEQEAVKIIHTYTEKIKREKEDVTTTEKPEVRDDFQPPRKVKKHTGVSTRRNPKVSDDLGVSTRRKPKVSDDLGVSTRRKPKVSDDLGVGTRRKPKVSDDLGVSTRRNPKVSDDLDVSTRRNPKVSDDCPPPRKGKIYTDVTTTGKPEVRDDIQPPRKVKRHTAVTEADKEEQDVTDNHGQSSNLSNTSNSMDPDVHMEDKSEEEILKVIDCGTRSVKFCSDTIPVVVSQMETLPDDRVLVLDSNNRKLKLFHADLKESCFTDIESTTVGLTVLDNIRVATACREKNLISIYSVTDRIRERTVINCDIPEGWYIKEICYKDRAFVCLLMCRNKNAWQIVMVEMKGQCKTIFREEGALFGLGQMIISEDCLYMSRSFDNIIHRFTLKGEKLPGFKVVRGLGG